MEDEQSQLEQSKETVDELASKLEKNKGEYLAQVNLVEEKAIALLKRDQQLEQLSLQMAQLEASANDLRVEKENLNASLRVKEQESATARAELEQARVASGWPAMGSEIDGSVTPAMTGLVAETVAFEKGCYTGQEFVARVHYRGAGPPKRLVQLAFDENSELLPGATITVEENQAGYVTSAARGVALGYLKRGFETPLVGHVDDVEVRLLAR